MGCFTRQLVNETGRTPPFYSTSLLINRRSPALVISPRDWTVNLSLDGAKCFDERKSAQSEMDKILIMDAKEINEPHYDAVLFGLLMPIFMELLFFRLGSAEHIVNSQ